MFHSAGQRFPKHYMMTLGVEFCVKAVTLQEENTAVEFHLFDTAGQVPDHASAQALALERAGSGANSLHLEDAGRA